MIIDSRYSKSFHSNMISDTKYKELYDIAISIRNIKNELSIIVNNNLEKYLQYSKIDFQKESLKIIGNDRISSNFTKQISDDVLIAYENKFKSVVAQQRFQIIDEYHFNYYKRDTKLNKKGDFKSISKKYKSSPLSICLSYLCRYGNENTYEYIIDQLSAEQDIKKLKFYENLKNVIDKYGFNRLYYLATAKRNRIIKKYSKTPIKFESLSFRGRSRLSKDIVQFNKNYTSIINRFINISWLDRGSVLSIPVKYSKSFHKNMKEYTNGTDTSYTIAFESNKKIRVILSVKDTRTIPENKVNLVGIDVNVKNNLMTCSNGNVVDYDRNVLNTLMDELNKIDNFKKNIKNYSIGAKRAKKIKHLRRELISKQRESFANLCKSFNTNNIDHAVFEDLDGCFGKSYVKDKNNMNYNRIISELNLSNVKNEFEHIAYNYDIAISFTNKAYTSQTCSNCGCIDSDNRTSQEIFECVECGFKMNADLNASINIKNRIFSTVIRERLHDKRKFDNGTYKPKIMIYNKVKDVLLSLRCNKFL